jgi:hypothetical protein
MNDPEPSSASLIEISDRLYFRMNRVKFDPEGVPWLRVNVAGRSGDPARRGGAGKLELTEAPRSKTVVEGIPEGFHPAASERVTLEVA